MTDFVRDDQTAVVARRSLRDEAPPWLRDHWPDVFIAAALALFAAASVLLVNRMNSRAHWILNDYWFDADLDRVRRLMTQRPILNFHTNIHPAFALFVNHPLRLLPDRLTDAQRALLLISVVSAVWVSLLYTLLRLIGCRRFDAVVFTLVGATSTAALFFSTVPETFPVATLTLLVVLVLVALERHRPLPAAAHIVAGAATMGVTMSHGMIVAIAALRDRARWKRGLMILVGACTGVIALSALQNLVFSESQFVLNPKSPAGFEEGDFIFSPDAGGPVRIVNAAVISSVVAPELDTRVKARTGEEIMTMQKSAPGSGSPWGPIAVAAWVGVLGLGLVALFKHRVTWPGFRTVLGLSLVAQIALYLVYGQETVTTTVHVLPFLLTLGALGTLTKLRPVVLALACVVLVAGFANNLDQLREAHDLYLRLARPFL